MSVLKNTPVFEFKEGAMADVLIYDANPLEDVAVVEKHQDHLKLIVKDGKVFKNTL